jgi:protein tyrosine phosphatase
VEDGHDVGTVTVKQSFPQLPASTDNRFVMSLPLSDAVPGKAFKVMIHADATSSIKSFVIELSLESGLTVASLDYDSSEWSVYMQSDGATKVKLVGLQASVAANFVTPVPDITIMVKVPDTTARTQIYLTPVVTFLTTETGDLITPVLAPQGIPLHINGKSQGDAGVIGITQDAVLGLFPYVDHAHLVNTAILTQTPITVPVHVLVVRSQPLENEYILKTSSEAYSCVHSNEQAFAMTPSCDIVFDGSESSSGEVTIEVVLQDNSIPFKASVLVVVWASDLDSVELVAADSVLNAIAMAQTTADPCERVFQRSAIKVFATFVATDASSVVDITHLVTDKITSSDEAVATVSVVGNTYVFVEGLAPGEATISIGGAIDQSTALTVSSDEVHITSFDLFAVQSISVNGDGATTKPGAKFSTTTLQSMSRKGQTSHVVAEAVFSDGNSQLIKRNEITVASTDTTVVTVTDAGLVKAAGNGVGVFLAGAWHVGTCSASGMGVISNTLEAPVKATVALASGSVTHGNDQAAAPPINLPAVLALQLMVEFENGDTQDVALDGQVEFDFDSDIIVIADQTFGEQTVKVVTVTDTAFAARTGTTTTVQATYGDLEASAAIDIVFTNNIAVSAYPYSGDAAHDGTVSTVTALQQIGTSGQFQEAILNVAAVLTNGEMIDVTAESKLRIANAPAWAAIEAKDGRRVLGHQGSASDGGVVEIIGTFGSEAKLSVEFSGSVSVTGIESVIFVASLYGPAGSTYEKARAVVTLSDDTTVMSFPGLLKWTSTDPLVASIDQSSGLVKLLASKTTPVTISASIGTFDKSAEFTCNAANAAPLLNLGHATGFQIAPTAAGASFEMPVRLTSLPSDERVDVDIVFDSSILEVTSYTVGPAFATEGLLHYGIFGTGTTNLAAFSPTEIMAVCDEGACSDVIFSVTFNVSSAATDGDYEIAATYGGSQSTVHVMVEGARRNRRSVVNTGTALAPSDRTIREVDQSGGDFNGDGTFDMLDYSEALDSILNFGAELPEFDVTGDGAFNLNDVDYLRRTLAGTYLLIGEVTVLPIALYSCNLVASVVLFAKGGDASNITTRVSFVLNPEDTAEADEIGATPVGAGVFAISAEQEAASTLGTIALHISTLNAAGQVTGARTQPVANLVGLTYNQSFGTAACETASDVCTPNPCLNKGTCLQEDITSAGFFCSCVDGWTGATCESEVVTSTTTSTSTSSVQSNETAAPVDLIVACADAPCNPEFMIGNCTDGANDTYTCDCAWPMTGSADCYVHICNNDNGGCGPNAVCDMNADEDDELCRCEDGFSGDDCATFSSLASAVPEKSTMASGNLITIAAVAGVLLLIVLPLVLVTFCKRSKNAASTKSKQLNWQGMDSTKGGTRGPPAYTAPMPTTSFDGTGAHSIASPAAQLAHLKSKMGAAAGSRQPVWQQEFASCPKGKAGASYRVSDAPENQSRNRYKDIRAYDDTRVFLMNEDNDYINANMVTTSVAGRQFWYIASQGPTPQTSPHFWDMVWEQQSLIIVMVTGDVEAGKVKCDRYWPDKGVEKQFGNLAVSLTRKQGNSSYTIRGIQLKHLLTGETRTVWQLHFTAWPDHGVPKDTSVMLAFIDELRSVRAKLMPPGPQAPWPLVVHCSAGIGRTGVVMALEIALAQLEAGELIDMKSIMSDLRDQRAGCIQKDIQFEFAYATLITAMENSELVTHHGQA